MHFHTVLTVGRGRWVVFTIGMGSWWAVFTVGRGSWWAVFVVRRGPVGADSGLLSSFVGTGSWGGARLCSPLVGWCWYWAVVVVGGVVMGRCQCSWGGGVVLGLGPCRRCWGW